MKPYYDDALIAAYMTREFGVKLYHPENEEYREEVFGFYDMTSFCNDHFKQSPQPPYYIHPDSYDVFEPMVGDVIGAKHRIEAGHGDFIYEELIEKLPFTDRLEYLEDIKIIRRNGKAFFMPKQESK